MTDFLRIFCAFATFASAGIGAALLVVPRRGASAAEVAGLTVVFGGAIISAAVFLLAFFLHGAALLWTISAGSLLLGLAGTWRARRRGLEIAWLKPAGALEYLLCGILLVQFVLVTWQTLNQPPRWDGLFSWEFKAHLAFLGRGKIPLEFFSDPSRQWCHPAYPLGLPLAEFWLYAWLGRTSHGLAKFIFPFFYFAAAAFLIRAVLKLGGKNWRALIAAALIFFVPSFVAEPGGILTGWADAPLATVYLAAVVYLLDYAVSGKREALQLLGFGAAILPWIKQEGAILWAVVFAIAFGLAWRRRERRFVLLAVLPGLLVIVVWKIFLAQAHAPPSQEFLPVRAATFFANAGRIEVAAKILLGQIFVWQRWSVLWIAAAVAFFQLSRARRDRVPLTLLLCILLPCLLYTSLYIFSAWTDLRMHVGSSLPRLLIDVVPVAVLAIALALPSFSPVEKAGGTGQSEGGGGNGAGGSRATWTKPL